MLLRELVAVHDLVVGLDAAEGDVRQRRQSAALRPPLVEPIYAFCRPIFRAFDFLVQALSE